MDKLSVGLVCVALGVVGCGKTEDGGKNSADPEDDMLTEDASKPLADLTDDEVGEVCEAFAAIYEDTQAYVRGICIVEAADSSSDVESCDAAAEACVGDLEIEPLSVDECSEHLEFTGCDASVRELNDCLTDQRKTAAKVAELRNCEDADQKGASTDWLRDMPACQELFDRCPEAFDAPPSETGGTSGGTPIEEETHAIEGNLGGMAVDIRPTDGLSVGESTTNGYWTWNFKFGGAAVWLWGETDVGQGLIQMPPSGPEASNWLCLDAVEVTRDADAGTGTWASNGLSVLPQCDSSDAETLELSFVFGEAVTGTLRGEPVSWVSSGFRCTGWSCALEFEEADTAWTERARWILELDAWLEEGATSTFEHATLIHPSGLGAVACGGGGFVEWGADNQFRIQVDHLGPIAECPGTPIEGDLSGKF